MLKKDSLLFKIVFINDIIIILTSSLIALTIIFFIFKTLDNNHNKETEDILKIVKTSFNLMGQSLEDDAGTIANSAEVYRLIVHDKIKKGLKPKYNKDTNSYYYNYEDISMGKKIDLVRFTKNVKRELYDSRSVQDRKRVLSLIDKNGKVIGEDRGPILNKSYSIEKRDDLIEKILRKDKIFNNNKLKIFGIDYVEGEKKLVLRAGAVVGYNHGGISTPQGAVMLTQVIDNDFLMELEKNTMFNKKLKLFFVYKNRYLFGRLSGIEKIKKDNFNLKLFKNYEYNEVYKREKEYIFQERKFDGINYSVGYYPIYSIDGEVIGFIGAAYSKQDLSVMKIRMLFIIGIITLLIIVLNSSIYGIASYKLIKPLIELAIVSRKISRGDYNVKIQKIRGSGEIKLLADSYESMIENIISTKKDLEDKNKKHIESINRLNMVEKLLFTVYMEEDMDKVIYYTLSAITSEVGLDYSRSIYLEYNATKNALLGKMSSSNIGLVTDNREKKNFHNFDEFLKDIKSNFTFQTESLDEITKLIKIPIADNVVAKAFNENKTIHCAEKGTSKKLGSEFLAGLSLNNFIIIPVAYRDQKFGCIIVDNYYKERVTTKEDIEVLNVFAMNLSMYFKNKKFEKEKLKNEKLSTIGTFASSIVHEIRSPLVGIKGFADMIKKTYKDDKKIQKYMSIITNEVNRLNSLSSMLLDYSKNKNYKLEKLEINDIIGEVLELLNHEITSSHVTVSSILGEGLYVNADRNKIEQVLMNVIKNGIEAISNENGKINIVTRNIDNFVELKIVDNGVGMDPKTVEKSFEPFITTKEQGTGLGLPIVYEIINNHDGQINIDSRVGEGTEVTIILKAYEEE